MTGVTGGTVVGEPLGEMIDSLHREPWYVEERFEAGDRGFGFLHHGDRDPDGRTYWQDGRRAGAVHGAITNRDSLGLSDEALFEAMLDEPTELLPSLEGPFVAAAVDGDRIVLATDKLGTRPMYYGIAGGLAFGSDVSSVLSRVDDPTVDEQGVSDLLLIRHLWGDRTLVREVRAVPPASVLVYDGTDGGVATNGGAGTHDAAVTDSGRGDVTIQRYWEFDFGRADPATYAPELVERYRDLIGRTATTMDGRVGLWLSGGLDSRSMAAELAPRVDSLTGYTYDANPSGGINLELAGEVSESLGIEHREVPLTADRFLDVLDRSVSILDGTVSWLMFTNLTASFNLPGERPDLLVEASGQGGLLGYDVWQDYLDAPTPAEALYRSDSFLDVETVTDLLAPDVDPMDSYHETVRRSNQNSFDRIVLDGYYRNFYPRGDFASNRLPRTQAGTRVPFADGDFLDFIAKMPREFRARAIPFTKGKVPLGTAPLKLALVRAQNEGLEEIPYERTRVPPESPRWKHAAGFVLNKSGERLRAKLGDRKGLVGGWDSEHPAFRQRIDGLLADAVDRPVFDADAVTDLLERRREGGGMRPTAAITTFELWAQQHLD